MKLQQKLLALAVLGLAATAPAHALINNGATDGNGELFLSIWSDQGTVSTADDRSYMRDLGVNINDWADASSPYQVTAAKTTAGFVQNFTVNPMLTTFLSAAPAGSIVRWNVVANDSTQARRFITTAAVGTVNLPTQSAANARFINTSTGSFLSTVNVFSDAQNATPSSNFAVNNSVTANFSDTLNYAGGIAWGTHLNGKTLFNTSGVIGDQLPFFMQYETSTIQTGSALQRKFTSALGVGADGSAAYWTLDAGGNLSYNVAAVPEADTWAMFAAGLLVVGAIARRRMAA